MTVWWSVSGKLTQINSSQITFSISGFELFYGQYYGVAEGGLGLSVLRTFRLLRIIKLVRFLPNLQRSLVVMLRTMDNVAVFFGMLMLFIFIFR